jgi:4-hydroxy-2-oxoheptanedioate aldolase
LTETERLRDRLRRGDRLAGVFLQAPSPVTAEVVSSFELDFVCVEAEHSPLGRESIHALLGAARGPALVRVADNATVPIVSALDDGAVGVIVPRVDSPDEARAAVDAARFPPLGRRGVGPGRASGYGRTLPDYFARANEDVILGVQIESAAALADVSAIAAVDGIDLLFLGPGDLAVSLGVPFGDERVTEAALEVLGAARAAGRASGTWAPNAAGARRWFELGFQLVIVGSDLALLADGVGRLLSDLSS